MNAGAVYACSASRAQDMLSSIRSPAGWRRIFAAAAQVLMHGAPRTTYGPSFGLFKASCGRDMCIADPCKWESLLVPPGWLAPHISSASAAPHNAGAGGVHDLL